MTTQAVLPETGNGLDGLVDAFTKIAPLFGSGTTTSRPDDAALGQSNQLLESLKGGVDPKYLEDMQNQIFDQAKQKIAPEILNSIGAGNRALSDTTLQDFASRATGYATAAFGTAKLEAINKNNALMAQIVDSQLKSSKVSATSASPAGKVAQIAGAALSGYSVYKKLTDKKKAPGIPNKSVDFGSDPGAAANPLTGSASAQEADDFFTGGGGVGTTASSAVSSSGAGAASLFADTLSNDSVSNIVDPSNADGLIAGGSSSENLVGDTGNDVLNPLKRRGLSDAVDGGTISDVASESSVGLDIADGADIAYDTGENLVDNFGGDFAGGIDFPYYTAFKEAGKIFDINEINGVTGAIDEGISDVTGAVRGATSDALGSTADDLINGTVLDPIGTVGDTLGLKVICTELFRQKLIPQHLYSAELIVCRKHISILTSIGYRLWATRYVELMKKYKLATYLVKPFAIAWANQVCYDYNNNKDSFKSSYLGKLLRHTAEPICYLIGRVYLKLSRSSFGYIN